MYSIVIQYFYSLFKCDYKVMAPIPCSPRIMWPMYWSFSFSISPSNEYSGLISFRMDWLDLLIVQGTLMSLLQQHGSKASFLRCSAFFIAQLSSICNYWKNHSQAQWVQRPWGYFVPATEVFTDVLLFANPSVGSWGFQNK